MADPHEKNKRATAQEDGPRPAEVRSGPWGQQGETEAQEEARFPHRTWPKTLKSKAKPALLGAQRDSHKA